MTRSIPRALIAALVGALAGMVCLALAFTRDPGLVLEMDRPLPDFASGFHPIERHGDETFVWTSRRADVVLAGLDRRVSWRCTVRFRGGRPDPVVQPVVYLAIDGVTIASQTATNEYQVLEGVAPERPDRRGLDLTVTSSDTFLPGPSDPRQLGVQVDRMACRPASGSVALPRPRSMAGAGAAAALFGAAVAMTGVSTTAAAGAAVLLAAVQAMPLASGPAPHGMYSDTAVRLALWIALAMVAAVQVIESRARRRIHPAGAFVLVFSAAALYLKLLALLHPSKLVVDAVFHAHRLDWVLAGRYYFTQAMPDGVQFPYAIALYLFAAPWSAVTDDHVSLLRIVVSASEVAAGALLYVMIARTGADRRIGAVAVVLFHLVPLPYWIIGNANLTNAFGQSAALVTLVAAATWPLGSRHLGQLIGLMLLAALAFLSHVSTFPLLAATLLALAFFYRWQGGPALHAPARAVCLATIIAAAFSVVSYYGHFGEVYKGASRVRAETGTVTTAQGVPRASPAGAPQRDAPDGAAAARHRRLARALALTVTDLGWPILVLAGAGAWRLRMAGRRDRLTLVLAAWGVAYVAFMGLGSLTPVDEQFERYADEFISRVNFATYPAAVMLAAVGAVWAWGAGTARRLAAAVLLFFALRTGAQQWAGWLQ